MWQRVFTVFLKCARKDDSERLFDHNKEFPIRIQLLA